jgi:hypothetical protein
MRIQSQKSKLIFVQHNNLYNEWNNMIKFSPKICKAILITGAGITLGFSVGAIGGIGVGLVVGGLTMGAIWTEIVVAGCGLCGVAAFTYGAHIFEAQEFEQMNQHVIFTDAANQKTASDNNISLSGDTTDHSIV